MSTPPIDGPQPLSAENRPQPVYGPPGSPRAGQQQGSSQGHPRGSPQGGSRTGRPPLWVGLGLLGLGVVACVIGLILMVTTIAGGVSQVAEARPSAQQQLEAGTEYTIFTDSARDAGPCTVFDPDFDIIDVRAADGRRTVTSEDRMFLQLGSFTTTDAGSYQVSCEGVPGSALRVAEVKVGEILLGALGGVIVLLLGGLLAVVGIVLAVVHRVTARRR